LGTGRARRAHRAVFCVIVDGAVAITLPGGCWLDDTCHREVRLRPISGSDEDYLLDAGNLLLPAHRATALIARCLERLGPRGPVTLETVRSLTVGDREALLLHLRHLTLGDHMQGVVDCPTSDCGEKMDLDLKVSDLLLPPYEDYRRSYEAAVADNGSDYRVRFRLPTGADQEDVAVVARTDSEAAGELLLYRCVESVTGEDGEPVETLPPAVADRISDVMSELDPQAELTLSLTCPACERAFLAPFDTASYLFRELDGRVMRLYREVHLLAFYYHWSEAEIIDMPDRKRRLYLELLEEALTQEAQ
jgi:hypothetical protein